MGMPVLEGKCLFSSVHIRDIHSVGECVKKRAQVCCTAQISDMPAQIKGIFYSLERVVLRSHIM